MRYRRRNVAVLGVVVLELKTFKKALKKGLRSPKKAINLPDSENALVVSSAPIRALRAEMSCFPIAGRAVRNPYVLTIARAQQLVFFI